MSMQEILEVITRHIQAVMPALANHEFKETDSMKELGLNSIDRSDIIMMTLETLSLRIPLLEMAKAKNIGELASIIHAKS